jgi:hypothetical protein
VDSLSVDLLDFLVSLYVPAYFCPLFCSLFSYTCNLFWLSFFLARVIGGLFFLVRATYFGCLFFLARVFGGLFWYAPYVT